MAAVAVARYYAVVELVVAGRVWRLGLGRPYPCAAARAMTRRNLVNRLPPMVLRMLSVAFVETVVMVLLEKEVMGLWTVIAVASVVQGDAVVKLASHLELVVSPYRHWKYTQSPSFSLVTVLAVSLRSRRQTPRTSKTWHS